MRAILLIISLCVVFKSYGQTEEKPKTWDNQLYIGNKIASGRNDWRYSGELQVRLKNNTQSLDNYFLEGVATYLINEKWELAPDFISILMRLFRLFLTFELIRRMLRLQIDEIVKTIYHKN